MGGTILLVHGTGVRSVAFDASFALARATAVAVGIEAPLEPCLWGDPIGIEFEGLSLPDDDKDDRAAAEDALWGWRFADPLHELTAMTLGGAGAPDAGAAIRPPKWRTRLTAIRAYRPSMDAEALLARAHLDDLWESSWRDLSANPVIDLAFERSAEANELADCEIALAYAIVATLHNEATQKGRPGPSAQMRDKLVRRLITDWGAAYALGGMFQALLVRAATAMVTSSRVMVAPPCVTSSELRCSGRAV